VKCKNEIILQKKYSSNFKNFRAGIAKNHWQIDSIWNSEQTGVF